MVIDLENVDLESSGLGHIIGEPDDTRTVLEDELLALLSDADGIPTVSDLDDVIGLGTGQTRGVTLILFSIRLSSGKLLLSRLANIPGAEWSFV